MKRHQRNHASLQPANSWQTVIKTPSPGRHRASERDAGGQLPRGHLAREPAAPRRQVGAGDRVAGRGPHRGIRARFCAADRFARSKATGFSASAKAHAGARHSVWPRDIEPTRASPRRLRSATKTRAWNQSRQRSSAPACRRSFFAGPGAAPGARDRRRPRPIRHIRDTVCGRTCRKRASRL